MPRLSAGLLLHRGSPGARQVLIGRMGGPLWTRRERAWTVPKGEVEPDEDPWSAARREWVEELGVPAPDGEAVDLGEVRQSGKVVRVWAVAGALDPATCTYGTFEMQWPPRSGRLQQYPELSEVAWHDVESARPLLVAAQEAFLDRLVALAAGQP